MSADLLQELLDKPVGPAVAARQTKDEDFTRRIEVRGGTAEVEIKDRDVAEESAAADFLRERGEDPAQWEASGFRATEWTMANGETGYSTRYTFRRVGAQVESDGLGIEELLTILDGWAAEVPMRVSTGFAPVGGHTYIVALGDTQFGKIDGDGAEGTIRRAVEAINRAAMLLAWYRTRYEVGHVHIAWLGDHIEGFVSQGGDNSWRTQLTLTEQIRLTRRLMLHALTTFAPLAQRVTMAAVPGNHDQAVRFGGGVTRYDDSHDTEALISVSDAAALYPDHFGHVEFYVPDTDELTVVVECSGTVVAHAHGHFWKPGKHFDWWRGQAFNKDSAMHQADLLLAGHYHHELIEEDGPRAFVQVPALEGESTWFRHNTGTGRSQGLMVLVTKDGAIETKEVVRG